MKLQLVLICLLLCSCMTRRGIWELKRSNVVISSGTYRYKQTSIIRGGSSFVDVWEQPWLFIDDRSGTLTVRYADGGLRLKEIWNAGSLIRSEKWNEDGILSEMVEMDSLTGCYTTKQYFADGKLRSEDRVLNHRSIEQKTWLYTGELYMHEITGWPENNIRTVRVYYHNGNLEKEIIYTGLDEKLSHKEWSSDGVLLKPTEY